MKVLHITTSDNGGAGSATIRLHSALLEFGIDSDVLCLYQSDFATKRIYELSSSVSYSFFRRQIRKLGFLKTENEKYLDIISSQKGSYEIYSTPFSNYRVELHPLINEADIINLHWVTGFINYPTFFQNIRKPIVWTLHDMNPFMGGFHYRGDYIRNHDSFFELESALMKIKKNAIKKGTKLSIVGLNDWICKESEKSEIFERFSHQKVLNTLNLKIFRPLNKTFAKELFGISNEKKVFLFVSQNINNYRKGFDLLLEAFSKIELTDNWILAAIGSNWNNNYPSLIKYMGQLNDPLLLSLAYNTADVLIIPSREDNLPNTMLEAMACGVPVIGTPVGGMLDVIKPGFNGILCKDVSVEGLKEAINVFIKIKDSFDCSSIRKYIEDNFNQELIAKEYIKLYNAILKKV